MLSNAKLQTINLLVMGAISLAGVTLVIALGYTVHQVALVEEDWHSYQADRSEKARLESALRASMGYGGMIHHFKNYILRNDESLMDAAQADIGAARSLIRQYSILNLGEAEKIALEDISQTLDKYDQALVTSRKFMGQTHDPEAVDQMVKVSDVSALRGLDTLRSEVKSKRIDTSLVKGRVAADIHSYLGYGGMIHDFKNLILRRDVSKLEKVENDIEGINKTMALYRTLSVTVAESIALEDIGNVLNQYKSKLQLIKKMITEGNSIIEIDQAVKVDDTLALRGLETLDREIAHQVDKLSEGVGEQLQFVSVVASWVSALMLGVILVVFIASLFLFNRYVIQPVTRMTQRMDRLSSGDTSVDKVAEEGVDLQNEIGQMARALVTFREYIIYKQESVEAAQELAATDALTGLDNRKRFEERLHEAISLAKRTDTHIACLMIDLDKFKAVNDTHGHGAGDEVLKTVAERLRSVSRESDFAARLGGDEFAMLLTAVDKLDQAKIPAKRIIDQLSLPIYYDDLKLEIGGSIGIAGFPMDAESPVDLVKHADRALYAAKDAGRGTFRFFNPDMLSGDEDE